MDSHEYRAALAKLKSLFELYAGSAEKLQQSELDEATTLARECAFYEIETDPRNRLYRTVDEAGGEWVYAITPDNMLYRWMEHAHGGHWRIVRRMHKGETQTIVAALDKMPEATKTLLRLLDYDLRKDASEHLVNEQDALRLIATILGPKSPENADDRNG